MYSRSINAVLSALRQLFRGWSTLPLLIAVYACLLVAAYLFVITREATVPQLILTFALMALAPALFFLLQAASVTYATGPTPTGLVRKASHDCLKLVVVSLPVIALTFLTLYVLGKLQAYFAVETNALQSLDQSTKQFPGKGLIILTGGRYLLIGVIVPLLSIQLWIATSSGGLRFLVNSLRQVLARTFAPQSVFVYGCGFLVFAVAPYFLVTKAIATQRAWLEVSVLVLRLLLGAVLILLGWVTTVGTLSILSTRNSDSRVAQE